MTLGSLSSFATTAFDTARTTFKAMAEAAVPPAEADRKSAAGGQTAAHAAPTAKAPAAGRVDAEEQMPASRRLGTLLDAYA